MPIEVTTKDGKVLQFPDGTAPEQIQQQLAMFRSMQQDMQQKVQALGPPRMENMLQAPAGPVAPPQSHQIQDQGPMQNAWDTMKGIGSGILNMANPKPEENTLHNLSGAVVGGVQKLIPGEQSGEKYFDALTNFMGEKYLPQSVFQGPLDQAYATATHDPLGTAMDASVLLGGTGLAAKGVGLTGTGNAMVKAAEMADPISLAMRGTFAAIPKAFAPKGAEAQALDVLNETHKLGLSPFQISDTFPSKVMEGAQNVSDRTTVLGRQFAKAAEKKATTNLPRANQAVGQMVQDTIRGPVTDTFRALAKEQYAPVDQAIGELAKPTEIDITKMMPGEPSLRRPLGSTDPMAPSFRGDQALAQAQRQLGADVANRLPDSIYGPTSNEVKVGRELGPMAENLPSSLINPPTMSTHTVSIPGQGFDTAALKGFASDLRSELGQALTTGDVQQLMPFLDKIEELPSEIPFELAKQYRNDINQILGKNKDLLGGRANAARAKIAKLFTEGLTNVADEANILDEYLAAEKYYKEGATALGDKPIEKALGAQPEKVPGMFGSQNPTNADALSKVFDILPSEDPAALGAKSQLQGVQKAQDLLTGMQKGNNTPSWFDLAQGAGLGSLVSSSESPWTKALLLGSEGLGGLLSGGSRTKLAHDLLFKGTTKAGSPADLAYLISQAARLGNRSKP